MLIIILWKAISCLHPKLKISFSFFLLKNLSKIDKEKIVAVEWHLYVINHMQLIQH